MSDEEGTVVQNQILNPAHQIEQLEVEGHVQLIESKSQMLDEVSLILNAQLLAKTQSHTLMQERIRTGD